MDWLARSCGPSASPNSFRGFPSHSSVRSGDDAFGFVESPLEAAAVVARGAVAWLRTLATKRRMSAMRPVTFLVPALRVRPPLTMPTLLPAERLPSIRPVYFRNWDLKTRAHTVDDPMQRPLQ